MKILNSGDILETIEMLTAENLDVRTVTMGISLLDCIDPDGKKACEKIYNKITRLAGNLVPVVNKISADYGIPIVNKRISVTPIAMLRGCSHRTRRPLCGCQNVGCRCQGGRRQLYRRLRCFGA